jgi:hypothetical protein
MAAFIHDDAFDAALGELNDATVLHILSQAVTAYGDVATYTLGNKSTPTFGAITNGDVSGRKLPVNAVSGGTVTDTGTASHVALVDGSRLLVCQALSSTQGVTDGNTFSLSAFDIEFPDPTA